MGYSTEANGEVFGREVKCPYCGTNNDRDRPLCWSCGKPLNSATGGIRQHSQQKAKGTPIVVDMPLSFKVLNVFAYIGVIGGILLCLLLQFDAGIAAITSGLLLFAMLGIWSAVERSATYLRNLAERN